MKTIGRSDDGMITVLTREEHHYLNKLAQALSGRTSFDQDGFTSNDQAMPDVDLGPALKAIGIFARSIVHVNDLTRAVAQLHESLHPIADEVMVSADRQTTERKSGREWL